MSDFATEEAVKELIRDFVELSEAKSLANRLAVTLIVQAISQITKSDFESQMIHELQKLRESAVFLAEDGDQMRAHVAEELGNIITALQDA